MAADFRVRQRLLERRVESGDIKMRPRVPTLSGARVTAWTSLRRRQLPNRESAPVLEQQVHGFQHEGMNFRALRICEVPELIVDRGLEVDGKLLGALLQRPLLDGGRDRRGWDADDLGVGARRAWHRGGNDRLQAEFRRL